ncbi:hypothetical protein SteCoe_4082 [Stentor coeruleus]|uniref:Uncharacterized protein n=1 Tax=Stentor coeruleus TaxID=5963 RepID=A0A1R2CVJ6_9CILI|nr:hypothetical protein SteCoe_4082 [Stentor coeruleus]
MKQAALANFSIEMSKKWSHEVLWYYLKLHKKKTIFGCFLGLLDYKYGIFGSIFNFFTDGRIKKYFHDKIFRIKENKIFQATAPAKSKFPKEIVDKYLEFFQENDYKLLTGIPRWVLVESAIEALGLEKNDDIEKVKKFYRVHSENLERPKNYNFSAQTMFIFLEEVEQNLKKNITDSLPSLLEKMKTKIPIAQESCTKWLQKRQQKIQKLTEDIQNAYSPTPKSASASDEIDTEITFLQNECMNINPADPQGKEKLQSLVKKMHELQEKKNIKK